MSSDPPSEKPRTKERSSSKPEAEYQEILHNPDIFLQKLKAFHSTYGTKFRMPIMGGNRLDLHLLFVEVTSRGGIEKVLGDRRWKEIIGVFKFPSSVTNASFVLRKYYMSLLYHFEQIYYLRKEEPSIPVSANKSSNGFTLSHSLNSAAPNQVLAGPKPYDSSLVTGTIDGKFDDGYLITVNLGSEELKGVLYHIPTSPNTSQGVSSSCDAAPGFHKKYHAHEKGTSGKVECSIANHPTMSNLAGLTSPLLEVSILEKKSHVLVFTTHQNMSLPYYLSCFCFGVLFVFTTIKLCLCHIIQVACPLEFCFCFCS